MIRMKRLLSHGLHRLGWPVLAGGALCGFALAFYFTVVLPAASRLEQLQRQTLAADARLRHAAPATLEKNGLDARFESFYQFFPARKNAPNWLGKIYAAARSQSLQLSRGEYKFAPAKVGKLASYQVSLPVKGSYLQIRKFVAQVLNEVPAASLDEISFKREAIGSAAVEAKIKLTLYLVGS